LFSIPHFSIFYTFQFLVKVRPLIKFNRSLLNFPRWRQVSDRAAGASHSTTQSTATKNTSSRRPRDTSPLGAKWVNMGLRICKDTSTSTTPRGFKGSRPCYQETHIWNRATALVTKRLRTARRTGTTWNEENDRANLEDARLEDWATVNAGAPSLSVQSWATQSGCNSTSPRCSCSLCRDWSPSGLYALQYSTEI